MKRFIFLLSLFSFACSARVSTKNLSLSVNLPSKYDSYSVYVVADGVDMPKKVVKVWQGLSSGFHQLQMYVPSGQDRLIKILVCKDVPYNLTATELPVYWNETVIDIGQSSSFSPRLFPTFNGTNTNGTFITAVSRIDFANSSLSLNGSSVGVYPIFPVKADSLITNIGGRIPYTPYILNPVYSGQWFSVYYLFANRPFPPKELNFSYPLSVPVGNFSNITAWGVSFSSLELLPGENSSYQLPLLSPDMQTFRLANVTLNSTPTGLSAYVDFSNETVYTAFSNVTAPLQNGTEIFVSPLLKSGDRYVPFPYPQAIYNETFPLNANFDRALVFYSNASGYGVLVYNATSGNFSKQYPFNVSFSLPKPAVSSAFYLDKVQELLGLKDYDWTYPSHSYNKDRAFLTFFYATNSSAFSFNASQEFLSSKAHFAELTPEGYIYEYNASQIGNLTLGAENRVISYEALPQESDIGNETVFVNEKILFKPNFKASCDFMVFPYSQSPDYWQLFLFPPPPEEIYKSVPSNLLFFEIEAGSVGLNGTYWDNKILELVCKTPQGRVARFFELVNGTVFPALPVLPSLSETLP